MFAQYFEFCLPAAYPGGGRPRQGDMAWQFIIIPRWPAGATP